MELKLDFNTPTMGPMEITYLGDTPSIKILDHNEHLKEVQISALVVETAHFEAL